MQPASRPWQGVLGSGNAVTFSLPIPAGTGFIGVKFFTQASALDQAANGLGGVMSDAAAFIIGM